jgi:hypothetical protein
MNLNESSDIANLNGSNDNTLVDEEEVTIINTSVDNYEWRKKIFTQKNIVVAVLFTINLVNFMDRFTIAGKMNQINI